ncbi:MAG TPA: hypothetical protein VD731_04700 [Nitrosopumilaceae archaeon]|nr:hypothetical protein [Nitrosopumilaceae archaeon]
MSINTDSKKLETRINTHKQFSTYDIMTEHNEELKEIMEGLVDGSGIIINIK